MLDGKLRFKQSTCQQQDSIALPEGGSRLSMKVAEGKLCLFAGHRVLLFSQMTRALDMVEDFLLLRKLSYLRLDGRTKSDARCASLKQPRPTPNCLSAADINPNICS